MLAVGCGGESEGSGDSTAGGGAEVAGESSGGESDGGATAGEGGSEQGGAEAGGAAEQGGAETGGVAEGGVAEGGSTGEGGAQQGGAQQGGAQQGGAQQGGAPQGGAQQGGAAGQGGTECFSPTENLDRAYDGEIPGCTCVNGDSVCISSVALICSSVQWQAVEDGPCMPTGRECNDRFETVSQCLNWFSECVEDDAGYFCGYGRKTDTCSNGNFVPGTDYCLVDDAFCQELSDGSYCTGVSPAQCASGWEVAPDGVDCDETNAGWCYWESDSLSCVLPFISRDECVNTGGLVASDPGDGSLMATGCEDGLATIGRLDDCEEGCLCCLDPYIGP